MACFSQANAAFVGKVHINKAERKQGGGGGILKLKNKCWDKKWV